MVIQKLERINDRMNVPTMQATSPRDRRGDEKYVTSDHTAVGKTKATRGGHIRLSGLRYSRDKNIHLDDTNSLADEIQWRSPHTKAENILLSHNEYLCLFIMDLKRNFAKSWQTQFPASEIPNLECFDCAQHGVEHLNQALCECKQRVGALQHQLSRELFLEEYLEDTLSRICGQTSRTLSITDNPCAFVAPVKRQMFSTRSLTYTEPHELTTVQEFDVYSVRKRFDRPKSFPVSSSYDCSQTSSRVGEPRTSNGKDSAGNNRAFTTSTSAQPVRPFASRTMALQHGRTTSCNNVAPKPRCRVSDRQKDDGQTYSQVIVVQNNGANCSQPVPSKMSRDPIVDEASTHDNIDIHKPGKKIRPMPLPRKSLVNAKARESEKNDSIYLTEAKSHNDTPAKEIPTKNGQSPQDETRMYLENESISQDSGLRVNNDKNEKDLSTSPTAFLAKSVHVRANIAQLQAVFDKGLPGNSPPVAIYDPGNSTADGEEDMRKMFSFKNRKSINSDKTGENSDIRISGLSYKKIEQSISTARPTETNLDDEVYTTLHVESNVESNILPIDNVRHGKKDHIYENWSATTSCKIDDIEANIDSDDDHIYDNFVPDNASERKNSDDLGLYSDEGIYQTIATKESFNSDDLVYANPRKMIPKTTHQQIIMPTDYSSSDEEGPPESRHAIPTDGLFPHQCERNLRPEMYDIESNPLTANSSLTSSEEDTLDVSCESLDELDLTLVEKSFDAEKLKMRKFVVKGILESEKSYLAILDVLLKYMKSLEASACSSHPVISNEDIATIFFNIPDLHKIHSQFVDDLEPRVLNWSDQQEIGDVFKTLMVFFPMFEQYVQNYQKAVETIHRCSEANQQFEILVEEVSLKSSNEKSSLEDILFKPVVRGQRNTLVLHDLLKYTPVSHPDHSILEKALKLTQLNLERFGSPGLEGQQKIEDVRYLVKSSFIVELVHGVRKLRHIFLFSDVIVCTKHKVSSRHRESFEVKWYVPLPQLSLDTRTDHAGDIGSSSREDVENIKKKISALKGELRREIKKEKAMKEQKSWSFSAKSVARSMDKIRKKVHEQEASLVLASPNLDFRLCHQNQHPEKVYTLLMTTDYEREEWRESVRSTQGKSARRPSLCSLDVQDLITNCKQLPKLNSIGSVLASQDDAGLNGMLNITLHKLTGLEEDCDTYCVIETDSFSYFFRKATTHICRSSSEPTWNEDFEIDLDGTQTLRLLCYRKAYDNQGDVLLGKSALELSRDWLYDNFQKKTISMNKISLVVSIRHTPVTKTMKRTLSTMKTGVFGVKLSALARREGKTIPMIVTTCIHEIEKRGMDESGIYRISGVTSDVQKLKKAFEKSSRVGANLVAECDIHAVTGVLKLYFRELPEPVFTEALYQRFVDTLELSDTEAKERCMMSLLQSIPEPSYSTAMYIIDHMNSVSRLEKENRMTLNSLSTIFGPTLLRPGVKQLNMSPMELLTMTAQQAVAQAGVLLYIMQMRAQGRDRKI